MSDAGLLKGKVAAVTGIAHPQGIGRAILEAFSQAGATVIGTDLPSQLTAHDVDGVPCDVTQPAELATLAEKISAEYGGLDILVNNAGVGMGADQFLRNTPRDWEISISVNLMGVVNSTGALLPLMRAAGSIINIASLAGLGALEGMPACYTATKFAVVGLTKSLAKELAPQQIRVNAICPGSVKTQMHQTAMTLLSEAAGVSTKQAEELENALIPMGRPAQPGEVASVAVFLASDASAYMTGVALPVAGGMGNGL
ncbi:MAG: SDR family oxidoreductase [Cellvibrionales bacterium]|jgi:3-oxoacyl-[acyl-carrier protein] reductase